MVSALQKPKNETDVRRVDPKAVPCFQSVTLSDFVTERSTNLFAALQMNTDFLASHPSQWLQCSSFCDSKEKAAAIRVINDCAERAVKLATDFNSTLSHDESQRPLIYQVVEYHRQLMSRTHKKHYVL